MRSVKLNNLAWKSRSASYSNGGNSLHLGAEAIGANNDYYGNISIGEMLIYDKILTVTEVETILNWLSTRWSIIL
jgi:hypothetical protein